MPHVGPLPIDAVIAQVRVPSETVGCRESIEQEQVNREKHGKWNQFRDKIGKRYVDCKFDTFAISTDSHRRVSESLQAFATAFTDKLAAGIGIVFLGPRGTGKDHLAVATVRECIRNANVSADWIDGQMLFSEFRDRISNEETEGRRIRELIAPQILVISDPVPQDGKLTDYQQGILWQIVDGRYRRMQSTWITANASSEADLCAKMGAQLVDRIVGGAMIVMTSNWKSHRTPGEIVK